MTADLWTGRTSRQTGRKGPWEARGPTSWNLETQKTVTLPSDVKHSLRKKKKKVDYHTSKNVIFNVGSG